MQPQVANRITTAATTDLVWDLFVRVAHWTIVAGFFLAYFTEDDALTLHVWAGYTVGIVVLLRIVWGFVGPRNARFADFLYRPSEVRAYLRDLLRSRARRYLGHSPAGGAMAFALWVGLLVTVGSGIMLYAIEKNAGPLAGIVTSAHQQQGAPALSEDREIGDGDAQGVLAEGSPGSDELWEELHEVAANLTLVLVILHVIGVLLAGYVHRENLARAMLIGRKRSL
jgi:cytochrome b